MSDDIHDLISKWEIARKSEQFRGSAMPRTRVNPEVVWRDNAGLGLIVEAGSIANPNPVDGSTLGKDQKTTDDTIPTPNWIDGDVLQQLNKLKLDFHELTSKLAAAGVVGDNTEPRDSMDKPGEDLMKQVVAMQKKIDELSDKLAPRDTEEESKS